MKARYDSFSDFYPFYLSEHRNRTCRRLHFAGTSFALAFLLQAAESLNGWWLLAPLAASWLSRPVPSRLNRALIF